MMTLTLETNVERHRHCIGNIMYNVLFGQDRNKYFFLSVVSQHHCRGGGHMQALDELHVFSVVLSPARVIIIIFISGPKQRKKAKKKKKKKSRGSGKR